MIHKSRAHHKRPAFAIFKRSWSLWLSGMLLGAVLLLITPFSSLGQLEYSNWHFPSNNYIYWDQNLQLHDSTSNIPANFVDHWGMASISDKNGNLIFYSDGKSVYNRLGQTIYTNPNLDPVNDALGRVLIAPKPCNDSIYYLFISGVYQNLNTSTMHLRYWEYNAAANNGLGSLVNTVGTTLVAPDSNHFSTNQLTGLFAFDICRHSNNSDFWLVGRTGHNDKLRAWQISDTGITSTPVTSIVNSFGHVEREHIDISPNGKWIGISGFSGVYGINNTVLDQQAMLLEFDNSNGSANFHTTIDTTAASLNLGSLIAPCFSPNSEKLYFTSKEALWQADLSSGIASITAKSIDTVATTANRLADIQIGPDGKIYVSKPSFFWIDHLGVINSPNNPINTCGFVEDGFDCNQVMDVALPTVIHGLFPSGNYQLPSIACAGDSFSLFLDNYQYRDSVHWVIDTGQNELVYTADSTVHTFDSAGLFAIKAISYSGCRIDTLADTIHILPIPNPDLGPDTLLCEGDTIAIVNDWLYSYAWSTGDSTQGIQVLEPDTFWLELTNFCGSVSDTVIIDSIIAALINFPAEDTLLCVGDTLILDASVDAGSYTWSNFFSGPIQLVTLPAEYWVESQNACATSTDTIQVKFTDVPDIGILDAVLCLGDTQFYNLETDSLSSFLWYNGDTSAIDTIIVAGTNYWVEETNLCGMDRDSFEVALVILPNPELGADTLICDSANLLLNAESPFAQYLWSSGDTTAMLNTTSANYIEDTNWFFVTVTNVCGAVADSIRAIVDRPLSPMLRDTTMCVLDHFQVGVGPFDRASYLWSDQDMTYSTVVWGNDLDSLDPSFSVTVTNGCGSFSDTMHIMLDQSINLSLGADRALCWGDTTTLFGGTFPRSQYLWNDSVMTSARSLSAGSSLLPVYEQTTFTLEVINTCNTFRDTIVISVDSVPSQVFQDSIIYICRRSSEVVLIDLNSINADSLLWEDGHPATSRTLNDSRVWKVDYFNSCGTTRDTVFGQSWDLPSISIEQPPLLCEPSIILIPEVDSEASEWTFVWSDESTLPDLFVDKVGSYAVTVTDDRGCKDSLRLRVQTCGNDFYIPNAFTPDGNRFNETWKPDGEGIESYTMNIYDRWGQLIFSFTNHDNGWDGSTRNGKAPLGLYSWRMEVISEDFREATFFDGTVTLLR